MDQLNKVITVAVLVLALSTIFSLSLCNASECRTESFQEGLILIESFYDHLLGGSTIDNLSKIFHGIYVTPPRKDISEEEAYLWRFFKKNKDLFLTDRYQSNEFYSPKDFFLNARKTYSFYNPTIEGSICDGSLMITLSSTIDKGGKDGVFKEITFPIVYLEKYDNYKINYIAIKVNGVLIDPYNDYTRSTNSNLWEKLGF